MSAIRQSVALGFILWALMALEDLEGRKRYIVYVLFVIIASLFHKTAVIPYISNIMNRIKNQRVAVIVKASFSVVIWSYSVIALVYRPEWQHIWPYHFYWQ